jgi:hypothetical protein
VKDKDKEQKSLRDKLKNEIKKKDFAIYTDRERKLVMLTT